MYESNARLVLANRFLSPYTERDRKGRRNFYAVDQLTISISTSIPRLLKSPQLSS